MAYKKIELVSFLKRLDRIFLENPDLWYEFILPKEKAEEFRIKYKNLAWTLFWMLGYNKFEIKNLLLWWRKKDWLCKKCFEKMQKDKKTKRNLSI